MFWIAEAAVNNDFDMIVKVVLGVATTLIGSGCVGAFVMVFGLNNRVVKMEERNKNREEEHERREKATSEEINRRFNERQEEREHERELLTMQLAGVQKEHQQETVYLKEQLAAIKETQVGLHRRFDQLLVSLDPEVLAGKRKQG